MIRNAIIMILVAVIAIMTVTARSLERKLELKNSAVAARCQEYDGMMVMQTVVNTVSNTLSCAYERKAGGKK